MLEASPQGGTIEWAADRAVDARVHLSAESSGRSSLWLWSFILVLAALDWRWANHKGWAFSGWFAVIASLSFLLAVASFYHLSGRNRGLADAANYAALWIAFALAGAIFTYLTATFDQPLRDAGFLRIDAELGFDWFAWSRWVAAHSPLAFGLEMVYQTFVPQIIGSALYFAHINRGDRNREFLWTGMVSLVITALIAGLIPAVGPYFPGSLSPWTVAFLALRAGTVSRFVFADLQGIIALPSFHAVVAILLIYSHRRLRSFYPMLVLNCLMLLSALSQGHHYLIDVIAGVALAVLTIATVRIAMKAGSSNDARGRALDAGLREPCYNRASDV